MRTFIAGIGVLSLCAADLTRATAQTAASTWAPNRDSVVALLNSRIAGKQSVGLIAGWSKNGVATFVAAGHRAGSTSAAPDSATIFEIGSISKVLTTTLLALMVERGEVSLEDPVARFLPSTVRVPSRNGKEIRLVDLATASSGLPRVPDGEPADPSNPYAGFEAPQLYRFLSTYTLPRDPGASYEYSNLGMGLLGHALALRSGKSYEEVVLERVLIPAGLRDTRIRLTGDQQQRFARGHDHNLDSVRSWDFAVLAGAGGWRSTAADMVRFIQAVQPTSSGPISTASTMAMTPQFPTGAPNLSIGLGWHVVKQGNRTIVWHNGETGGYHAFIGLIPETGANVVVLSNAAIDIDEVGLRILDPTFPLRPLRALPAEVAVPDATLDRHVGRYRLAPTFDIEITRTGNRLYAQATGQARFRIRAASPTRYYLTVVDAAIEFVPDSTGQSPQLILHQGGQHTPGNRIPEQ